eukprot:NODE_5691_length_682_cov_245.423423_g5668_i0.p2 GENE.NODE_5691_length_682_cov_245.423423_g5668_i0~~NODE_5691_length_682_cov_245.423423_g5668_i0.p2  ORF type:complete len:186 (+),score=38.58 NODE_5691_length_682_cov_245.423423_g5668_i0:56-613(+)
MIRGLLCCALVALVAAAGRRIQENDVMGSGFFTSQYPDVTRPSDTPYFQTARLLDDANKVLIRVVDSSTGETQYVQGQDTSVVLGTSFSLGSTATCNAIKGINSRFVFQEDAATLDTQYFVCPKAVLTAGGGTYKPYSGASTLKRTAEAKLRANIQAHPALLSLTTSAAGDVTAQGLTDDTLFNA